MSRPPLFHPRPLPLARTNRLNSQLKVQDLDDDIKKILTTRVKRSEYYARTKNTHVI